MWKRSVAGALVLLVSCASAPDDEAGGSAKTKLTADGQYLGEQLSVDRIAKLAKDAGLPCSAIVTAVAVAMGESEGFTRAIHYNADSVDRGLWQINSKYWPAYDETCVYTPSCNAKAMAEISSYGSSFTPWLAFTNGRYEMFLAQAQGAYARLSACGGTGAPSNEPSPESGTGGSGGHSGGFGGGASCSNLGYRGACVGGISIWSDHDGTCKVRDCPAEGGTCGLISQQEGLGCLRGTGATTSSCASLGYEGKCMQDTLVYANGGKCIVVDCARRGQTCGMTAADGYDCK